MSINGAEQLVFVLHEDVIFLIKCPGGLMDKIIDSDSVDMGSIPVRDAILRDCLKQSLF